MPLLNGSTYYLKQSGSNIYYSANNSYWILLDNKDIGGQPQSVEVGGLNPTTVHLVSDLIITSEMCPASSPFFELKGSNVTFEGNRYTIFVSGKQEFLGLVNNDYNNGCDNIKFNNIGGRGINGTTLHEDSGFFGSKDFEGSGHSFTNVYVIADFPDNVILNTKTGALLGTQNNDPDFVSVSNCYAVGHKVKHIINRTANNTADSFSKVYVVNRNLSETYTPAINDGIFIDKQWNPDNAGLHLNVNELIWNSAVSGPWPFSPNIICFKEGTKILCLSEETLQDEYVPIEKITPGMYVKTFKHDYVPVYKLGSRAIVNPGNTFRSKDRLYLCSKEQYPSVQEDLVMTGCHSILVDKLTYEQEEATLNMLGKLKITDGKFRLMAVLDEKAEPYQKSGSFNVWHIALDNKDYYMNYGIYANGLLVESCSKRMMDEYSFMDSYSS